MTTLEELRRRPARERLDRLAAAIAPGGTITRVRRLRGGQDAATHALALSLPSGERRGLVLRRYPAWLLARDPDQVVRAYRTLTTLERIGVHAPHPVLLDREGAILGAPGYVMTRLPGHAEVRPRDRRGWLRGLGGALAVIHRAPIAGVDLSFLRGRTFDLDDPAALIARYRDHLDAHPDGAAVASALARWAPRVKRPAPALTHGDYWAGNTLWQRGRLTGVVDWDFAGAGIPSFDVGYCRFDLALMHGRGAAAEFLAGYEDARGELVADVFFWDLLGVLMALPDPAVWLPGYHDLGLTEISADDMRARLRAFVADALDRAG